MSLLPKIKRCPSCDRINFISINSIHYKNNFKSLKDWELKKVFHCKKCKVELGFFLNSHNNQEKLIWTDLFRFEDNYYDDLVKLDKDKLYYFKNKSNKKYHNVLKAITDIKNKIRINQTNLKVKLKIQNKQF